jgi:DNA-directed RNA polymerase specialized sigma24 family protein
MMGVFGMSGKEAGRIRAFMGTLNRTERLILLLFYADQLSQTEIGLVLDLPESRVNTMLGSLKRQASAALKHEGSFGGLPRISAAMS